VPAEAVELLEGLALESPVSLAARAATQQQLVVLHQLQVLHQPLQQEAVLSVAALHPRCPPELAA
jgi:hypothetical protein